MYNLILKQHYKYALQELISIRGELNKLTQRAKEGRINFNRDKDILLTRGIELQGMLKYQQELMMDKPILVNEVIEYVEGNRGKCDNEKLRALVIQCVENNLEALEIIHIYGLD